jgi:hypothetical protein
MCVVCVPDCEVDGGRITRKPTGSPSHVILGLTVEDHVGGIRMQTGFNVDAPGFKVFLVCMCMCVECMWGCDEWCGVVWCCVVWYTKADWLLLKSISMQGELTAKWAYSSVKGMSQPAQNFVSHWVQCSDFPRPSYMYGTYEYMNICVDMFVVYGYIEQLYEYR